MRKVLIVMLFFPVCVYSQTVFWTETFDNGCVSGCLASTFSGLNGAWSVASNGANGAAPNQWFVSCAENGNAAGTCGSACGTNATLHIGANPNSYCTCIVCPDIAGDCGAAYDACDPPDNFCGGGDPTTNTRAISPTISTLGKTGISVSFDYLEGGQTVTDNAICYYSTNNGATWTVLVDMAKTTVCISGQGRWANYTSAALPVACNNIATFRISFVWQNNADNVGTDPSVAINDLKIRYTAVLPVSLINFTAQRQDNDALLKWATASEVNNDYFEVLSSHDDSSNPETGFETLGRIKGNGNATNAHYYSFADHRSGKTGTYYYRLKQVDYDGAYTLSDIAELRFGVGSSFHLISITPNPFTNRTSVQISSELKSMLKAQVLDLAGREISSQSFMVEKGIFSFDPEANVSLSSGIYFIQLSLGDETTTSRLVKE